MAGETRKPPKKQPPRPSSNAYKKGKLSKNARFSPRRIKWTPVIILLCVLATVIFAVIFGNFLGKKAKKTKNDAPDTNNSSTATLPNANKVSPKKELQAYFADLQSASPDTNISLSVITESPRSQGNALFVNIKNDKNEIIYSSEKVIELGFEHQDNLALTRLKNHFEYYEDFAIGLFKSDFSANLDNEKALRLQTNEILLLQEATNTAFNQIIIEFSGNITKDNLLYYQTYLLNLKLACPKTPIGIKLNLSFLQNSDNAGNLAGLMNIADFFVLDFGKQNPTEIANSLEPIVYFTQRYDCVVMISDDENASLLEKIATLSDKGIKNYIVN